MPYYTVYWLNSPPQIMEGSTIAEAFKNAGFGGNSISAVDWYEEI